MKKRLAAGLILLSGLSSSSCFAADSDVNLHGTLIEMPPCIVNDNNIITVDFGEVMTTRVDGQNYMKQIDYTIDCSEAVTVGKTVLMGIVGIGADFDSEVLDTSVKDLGIELKLMKVVRFKINEFNLHLMAGQPGFDPTKPTDLYAVPVKRSGAALSGGAFRATASMVLRYQ